MAQSNSIHVDAKRDDVALQRLLEDPGYSARRYFVDKFLFSCEHLFTGGKKALDIGGKRAGKRGAFDLERFPVDVDYVNIDASTDPDYLCDSSEIPVTEESYDLVVLAEILEHLVNPEATLTEAYRVLRPGGFALVCSPFVYHVHADPDDFQRFTDSWYRRALGGAGFSDIMVRPQGGYLATLVGVAKFGMQRLPSEHPAFWFLGTRLARGAFAMLAPRCLRFEATRPTYEDPVLAGHCLGFEVTCRK
jgi:SAM-dependent methyltransferase